MTAPLIHDAYGRTRVLPSFPRHIRTWEEDEGDHCQICNVWQEYEQLDPNGVCLACDFGPPPDTHTDVCTCCGAPVDSGLCPPCESRARKEDPNARLQRPRRPGSVRFDH